MPRSPFSVRYSEDQADELSFLCLGPAEAAKALRFLDTITFTDRAAAMLPTNWPPGTMQKLAIMQARAALGLSPFCRGDADFRTRRQIKHANGSWPLWKQRPVEEQQHLEDEELTEEELEAKDQAEFWAKTDEVARAWLAPDTEEFRAALSPETLSILAAKRSRREAA